MKLWNVPVDALSAIVREVSARDYNGNIRFKRSPEPAGRALQFTLTVADSRGPGGRLSHSGRRVAALCWHGHRDVFKEIFARFPDARLQSAQADYRGRESFERTFPATGDANIGSLMCPMCYRTACDCGGS